MEAKLIKKSENYYELYEVRTNLTLLVGSTDSERKIDVYGKDAHKLLSIKNCEAIANGYDLDELADEYCNKIPFTLYEQEIFKDGFQKALEILGDKKFSEKDVISMIEKSRETGLTAEYLILNNQQTEWEVEIEMENKPYKYLVTIGEVTTSKLEPKLDADGCLILKRKL